MFVTQLSVCISLYSQRSYTTILEQPAKYQKPTHPPDYSPAENRMPSLRWKVYSDRDNNQTFTTAGGTQPMKTLHYMQDFYVVDEQGEYVRIFKDPSPVGLLGLSPNAEDFGWIHKSKLILWRNCLFSEDGRIPRKGMILNTIRHLRNPQGNPDIVMFRNGPSLNYDTTGHRSNLFQFFFVLKQEGDWILLMKENKITEVHQSEVVVGWAPFSRVTLWDHRKAIEPNWEPQAVSERRYRQIAKVFDSMDAALEYRDGKTVSPNKVLWDRDPFEKRPIGEWRRFPIIGRSAPGILKVGAMGAIYSGNEVFDQSTIAMLQKRLDDLIAYKRNVNIVFVIDGSTSMKPYFSSVAQAIKSTMPKLASRGTRNKFKFGAVIYRDYDEGQRLTQVMPLHSNYDRVATFLDPNEARDENDKDTPEAVFYGLLKALRATGLNPKETNILMLIGDAGNHSRRDPSQVDPTMIIQNLVELDCHLLAFQVHHQSHPSYDDFISQLTSIVQKAAETRYSQVEKTLGSNRFPPPQIHSDHPEYRLEHGVYVGAIYGIQEGKELNPTRLTSELSDALSRMDILVDSIVETLKKVIDGSKLEIGNLAPGIISLLERVGIQQRDMEILMKDKYQIFVEGHAPLRVRLQKEPLYKQVLFLSREELGDMVRTLRELSVAVDEREKLQEAWKVILKTYIGNLKEEDLKKTLQEIQEMVWGLPGTNDFLEKVRLIEITDPRVFPDHELRRYVNRINERAGELTRIFNMDATQFPYGFRSNEVPYYWIDEDLIP